MTIESERIKKSPLISDPITVVNPNNICILHDRKTTWTLLVVFRYLCVCIHVTRTVKVKQNVI